MSSCGVGSRRASGEAFTVIEPPLGKAGRARMPAARRRGFTLIELLVVIAILILLLSLLAPSMRRAKELARRFVCRNNVRRLGVIMSVYANRNNRCIPLGYQGNGETRQTNYQVLHSSSSVNRPDMHLGCLYNDKLLDQPKTYYCPCSTIELFQYDTYINPWLHITRPGQWNWCRLGYGTRPLAGWGYYGQTRAWVIYGWPDRYRREMPRTDQLDSGMAILSDIVSTADYVDTHHGDGVNFVTASGSAHWFDRSGFNLQWESFRGYGYFFGNECPGFYNNVSSPPNGVWFDMDR